MGAASASPRPRCLPRQSALGRTGNEITQHRSLGAAPGPRTTEPASRPLPARARSGGALTLPAGLLRARGMLSRGSGWPRPQALAGRPRGGLREAPALSSLSPRRALRRPRDPGPAPRRPAGAPRRSPGLARAPRPRGSLWELESAPPQAPPARLGAAARTAAPGVQCGAAWRGRGRSERGRELLGEERAAAMLRGSRQRVAALLRAAPRARGPADSVRQGVVSSTVRPAGVGSVQLAGQAAPGPASARAEPGEARAGGGLAGRRRSIPAVCGGGPARRPGPRFPSPPALELPCYLCLLIRASFAAGTRELCCCC